MKSKRFLSALLAALAAALMLAACGSADEHTGRYICTDSLAMQSGVNVDEEWLELSAYGKGVLHLMGEDYDISWTLTDEELTLTQGGRDFAGQLSDGVLSVSFDGLIYTYVKEGNQAPATEDGGSEHTKLNALQKWWNGKWYGWWGIHDATGEWSELDGSWYDCYADIELDAAGLGSISVWDDDSALCTAALRLSTEDTESRVGAVYSDSGHFWSWRIGEDDWTVDPSLAEYENVFLVKNGYFEDENGSFRYDIFLRPWGQLWDDIAASDLPSLPEGYYTWYLPLVEAGMDMPETIMQED